MKRSVRTGLLALITQAILPPTAPLAAPLPGQIMLSPDNKSCLVYNRDANGDGTPDPAFLCGAGGPEGFLFGEFTAGWTQESIIDFLKVNGGNTFVMITVRSHGGDGDATQNPFVGGNPANGMNQQVLDKWDGWITRMERAGIYVYLQLHDDGVKYLGDDYVKAIVNRFKHHANIIWCLAEEIDESMSAETAARVVRVIQANDEYGHLIGADQLDGLTYKYASVSPIYGVQTVARGVEQTLSRVHADAVALRNMAEGKWVCFHTGNHYFDPEMSTFTDELHRKGIWALAIAGNHHAHHGLWEKHVPGRKPPTAAMCRYDRILGRFMESLPDLLRLRPHDTIVKSGAGWAMLGPARAVVYLRNGGKAEVDLTSLRGALSVEWFNPRTGEQRSAVSVGGGAVRSFSAPDANDWVLNVSSPAATRTAFTATGRYSGSLQYNSRYTVTTPVAHFNRVGFGSPVVLNGRAVPNRAHMPQPALHAGPNRRPGDSR